ncbi:hypothetical protein QZM22_02450 [Burkholderia oklahomensis]|nr:hypothetical protein [Burkholderia oklahomensis]MDN7671409.1 hypothetical protein [Burkholderia oklahomensis]
MDTLQAMSVFARVVEAGGVPVARLDALLSSPRFAHERHRA